jgi:signal transduction histidine kinase
MRQAVASRLGAINDVTRIVTGSLEMQQVLNSALARILEITNAQIALAYLLDGDNDELVLTACRGLIDGSERAIARLGPDDGVIGEVGQTGEPLVLDDAGSRPRSIPALAALEEASSFVAVPLRSSSRVLGVMALAGSRADPFTPQDVQLLIAIGGQIGVAVENVRLYESMRYYARQVTRAQEDERKRIARDLHDETMQALIAISRRIEGLTTGSKKQPADVARRLEELRGLAGDALKELRRFVRDLRPPALDHLGLMAALASLADDLRAESEIETEIDMIGQVRRLTPDQELGLFRIFQETLTNVRRHSGAHRVAVQVAFQPDRVQMIVRDDGRGFDAPERANGLMSTGGLGLVGMIERAHLLGGTLVIRSRPGEGTTVTVEVPT